MNENTRIAKNSFILYFRLLVTTFVGLYTSRIVMLELGISSYGLYSVVGGVVAMLNVMSTSMISTSNRFLAIELGKKGNGDLNSVFNALLIIHVLFAFILFAIVEIAGIWYVNNFLKIDSGSVSDALFVLHFSTLSAMVSTISIPYQGLLTANEKFNVKAGIDVVSALLSLISVLLLSIYSGNKLRLYSTYIFIIQLVIAVSYYGFVRRDFAKQITWKINRDWRVYKLISSFFGWQLFYVFGSVGARQGGNMIINLFFGTSLNATFSIASKVNEFVYSFVKNLNMAAIPQIMKSYSSGNNDRSLQLVYSLSKLTYFIMLLPTIPILLSIDVILILWLKVVPPLTSIFVVLRVVHGLISCLESGFDAIIDATGRIRFAKIMFSVLFMLTVPLTYFSFSYGFPAYGITVFYIVAEFLYLVFQLFIMKSLAGFSLHRYFVETIIPVLVVTLSLIPFFVLKVFLLNNAVYAILLSVAAFFVAIFVIYFFGMKSQERVYVDVLFAKSYDMIINKFHKIKTK